MGDTVGVYNVHTLHSIIMYAVCGNLCVQLFMVFTDGPVRAKVETIKTWKVFIVAECKQSSKRHSEAKGKNFLLETDTGER